MPAFGAFSSDRTNEQPRKSRVTVLGLVRSTSGGGMLAAPAPCREWRLRVVRMNVPSRGEIVAMDIGLAVKMVAAA